ADKNGGAGTGGGKDGRGDGVQSGRQKRDARASRAFDLLHRLLQRFRCGRAAPAIVIAAATRQKIIGGGIEDRRGVVDRRIHKSIGGKRVPAAGAEACIWV